MNAREEGSGRNKREGEGVRERGGKKKRKRQDIVGQSVLEGQHTVAYCCVVIME